jgi:hypothetical protein
MAKQWAMTAEQEQLALELIHDPPPGSKLATAKPYGIDLTLLHEKSETDADREGTQARICCARNAGTAYGG